MVGQASQRPQALVHDRLQAVPLSLLDLDIPLLQLPPKTPSRPHTPSSPWKSLLGRPQEECVETAVCHTVHQFQRIDRSSQRADSPGLAEGDRGAALREIGHPTETDTEYISPASLAKLRQIASFGSVGG